MTVLEGRVALVTGSARGIGAAIAERLARDGAAVAINYLNSKEHAEAVAEQIRKAGGNAAVIQADTSPGEVPGRVSRRRARAPRHLGQQRRHHDDGTDRKHRQNRSGCS